MRIARFLAAAVIACASLPLHAQTGDAAPPAAVQAALENSVVKVFSTLRPPDPFKPWSKAAPVDITGSGVIIDGKRILTNAHVVGYASQVQVQANQAGDKVSAKVVAISRGMDLAILKLDDESFFDKRPAVKRGSMLPEVRDAVFAYGYPTGGNSLSITKGIVSRIEFVNYRFASSGLRIQVDAAINPGNSGGPAIAGERMIGLAFATASNAQNVGYIIPNEEIELFLKDVADGHYEGKPALLDDIQTLENPALRSFLKLDKSVEGAVVHRVNGKVALTIVRDGKSMEVKVPVGYPRKLLIPELDGSYPSYFIYGPIVFSRASAEFAAFGTANANAMTSLSFLASPLVTRRGDPSDSSREELVVVSSPFFPHKLVSGYSNRFGSVIYSVNKIPVRSLRHLVALLRDMKDELIVIHFDQRTGETMVLPRQEMVAATDDILTDNGIRAQGSQDMLDVWNGK